MASMLQNAIVMLVKLVDVGQIGRRENKIFLQPKRYIKYLKE